MSQDSLAAEVRALASQLQALSLRVSALEGSDRESAPGSFSVVEPHDWATPEGPALPVGDRGAYPCGTKDADVPWHVREEVAKEIGRFLRRCLNGEQRGLSGRERLKHLASRHYVVARDCAGRPYNPVKVYGSYREMKSECLSGGDCGEAVFVGVPSLKEAKLAVAIAGLLWPGGGP